MREYLSRPRDPQARVSIIPSVVKVIRSLPRCKNVWYFFLVSSARALVWLLFDGLGSFVFLVSRRQ